MPAAMSDPAAFDPIAFLGGSRDGHIVALGLEHSAMGEDWYQLALGYDRRLVSDAGSGILASGPIVSLMDTAGGIAVRLRAGIDLPRMVTLDLRLDYLRPARPGMRVYGRAECYRLTRRVGFVRGIAHDGDPDDPVAHMAATFLRGDAE